MQVLRLLPAIVIQSISKKISDKNLTLEYNKAKIKNNPINFKFNERVIGYSNFNENLYAISLDITGTLLRRLGFDYTNLFYETFGKSYIEIKEEARSDLIKDNNDTEYMPSCFIKKDNLYYLIETAIYYVLDMAHKNGVKEACPATLNTKEVIEKINYLFKICSPTLNFLTTEKSICMELVTSNYNFTNSSFEDLRNLKDNTEILLNAKAAKDAGEVINLLRLDPNNRAYFLWTPLNREDKDFIEQSTDVLKANAMNNDLYLSYELALEIMYYIFNTNQDLYDKILNESSTTFNDFIKDAYMHGILLENNPKERFVKIKKCMQDFRSSSFSRDFLKLYEENNLYVSNILFNLIKYAQNYGLYKYELNTTLLLLQYAKINKIDIYKEIKAGKLEVSKESLSLIGFLEETFEASDLDYFKYNEDEAFKMPNDAPNPKKETKFSPAIPELGEFSKKGYEFKVENKISLFREGDTENNVISAYNAIADMSKMICNNLTKQIKDIKCYNFGGKNSGKTSGKLDNKRLFLYKAQKNVFYNNTYKIKEMDPVFGIILDQSGSMRGDGIKNGKITMIVLHEVLKSLGVNHSIIGHTSRGFHNSIIYKYVNFRENKGYSLKKAYDLANISALWGNCDSGALYYMEQQLLKTQQKDRICLIFSDGYPTECSKSELIEQVKHMEKEGIKTIGIGINFDQIKEYYSNNANGKDLKEMLDIVCKILKQYVLEKENK